MTLIRRPSSSEATSFTSHDYFRGITRTTTPCFGSTHTACSRSSVTSPMQSDSGSGLGSEYLAQGAGESVGITGLAVFTAEESLLPSY